MLKEVQRSEEMIRRRLGVGMWVPERALTQDLFSKGVNDQVQGLSTSLLSLLDSFGGREAIISSSNLPVV
jgi:hypothetical protein